MSGTPHHLKIVLDNVKPSILREVIVPSDLRLDRLHTVIRIAMGWTDSHMPEFIVGTSRDGERYGMQVPDEWSFGEPTRDEKQCTLERVAPTKGGRFRYWYDFGDDRYHTLTVKAIIPAASNLPVPYCVKAARACPPEDCGGPWGYANLLAAPADPADEEHDEMREWAGEDFDPERVDVDVINAELIRLRAARQMRPARRKASS